MTNTKTTKRALLTSVMAMFLCFTMLLGTTFAWFTDTATSSKNKIVAGNLDVELLMYDADAGKYVNISSSQKPIFESGETANETQKTLWEPGKTNVAYLAIENAGNLDLKYKVALDVKNVKDDLYKVMSYTISPDVMNGVVPAWDAANAKTVVPGVQEVTTAEGELGKGETHYFALSIHMDENAGNEYKNAEVDFDLIVLATQLNAEFDSFNSPDYDKDAMYSDGVVVTTDAELAQAIADGKRTIYIEGAVATTAANAGSSTDLDGITLIGASAGATLEIKGTGGGLSNVNMKDLTVIDSTFYTSENGENAWEFTYLELEGSNTFTNVAFADGVMFEGSNTLINCSFSGHNNDSSEYGNTTMYGAWVYDGTASFTNCTFTGTRGLKVADQYTGSDVSNVVVDNCTFDSLSEKPGVAVDNRLGSLSLTIKNSTFINCKAGDAASDSTKGVPYIYENDNTTPDVTSITLENNTVINAAISYGRIEYISNRYQLAADVTANGVNTLAVKILDQNGAVMTTITPEGYSIPDNGTIPNLTVCAAVTGDSSSWKHDAFKPSLDVVPTTMVLVVNDIEVAKTAVVENTYPNGKSWVDTVKAVWGVSGDKGYTSADRIWGETHALANESYIIKAYSADNTYMGYASLIDKDNIIDGDVNVTWSMLLNAENGDYWTRAWEVAPTIDKQPTTLELWVDGVKVSVFAVQLNAPDNLNPITGAVVDANNNILRYVVQGNDANLQDGETLVSLN